MVVFLSQGASLSRELLSTVRNDRKPLELLDDAARNQYSALTEYCSPRRVIQ